MVSLYEISSEYVDFQFGHAVPKGCISENAVLVHLVVSIEDGVWGPTDVPPVSVTPVIGD